MEKELKRVSVVPMRGMVLFPHMTLNFDAAREMSIKALESAAENDSIVFLAAQKDYTIEQPTVDDIYSIGTFAVIKQVMRMPGGITRVIVKGWNVELLKISFPKNRFLRRKYRNLTICTKKIIL